jgi:DNA-binding FadR family transcriptional regulator
LPRPNAIWHSNIIRILIINRVSSLVINKLRGNAIGNKTSLHGRIAERLGVGILSGKILPGEVLPNEAALGASFNVSRTAVREAIKVLTSKGLVEVRRKTGTRIRPKHDWHALDPDVVAWQFSGDVLPPAITDLLELREIIEPICARLAAERATTEDVNHIETAFQQMENAIGKTSASVEADLSFHLAILEATHNAFMRPFGALIQAALRASFRQTNADPTAYQRSLSKHKAVLAAIKSKTPLAAETAMLSVLHGARYDLQHAPVIPKRKSALKPLKQKAATTG